MWDRRWNDDPDRWRKMEQIFHQALERPESEMEAWLDVSSGGDAELRTEVVSLLESDRVAALMDARPKMESRRR